MCVCGLRFCWKCCSEEVKCGGKGREGNARMNEVDK